MYLYYDRVSKMFTLDLGDEGVEFLGPITNALVTLKSKYLLSDSQAREATLQAVFNYGDSVDISMIKKVATKESQYFRTQIAQG